MQCHLKCHDESVVAVVAAVVVVVVVLSSSLPCVSSVLMTSCGVVVCHGCYLGSYVVGGLNRCHYVFKFLEFVAT